jgi:hypothetical protein
MPAPRAAAIARAWRMGGARPLSACAGTLLPAVISGEKAQEFVVAARQVSVSARAFGVARTDERDR